MECAVSSKDSENDARIMKTSEYKGAAECLAQAFADDDIAKYFIDTPDRAHWSPEDKWKLHCSIMEYITYAHCLKGMVVTAGAQYGCVALWMPPGANMDDVLTIMLSGLWRLSYKLSREGRARFFNEFLPLLNQTKASVLGDRDEHSYYLVYIGTRPECRGKGLAQKCIQFVTNVADRESLPCYLESSIEGNPTIYRRMGFEPAKQIALKRAEKEIDLQIMVREPVIVEEGTHAEEGLDKEP